jgi:hypothetical protein
MNRDQLLKKIDTPWAALRASYAWLSEAQLTQPGVTGDWSVIDILAHVMAWENEALLHLPHILEGKRPPKYSDRYGGIDAFNDLKVRESRALPPAEVLARVDATHGQLLAYLESAPAEQLATETRFRRRIRLDTYSHYPIHTQAILAWREQQGYSSSGT